MPKQIISELNTKKSGLLSDLFSDSKPHYFTNYKKLIFRRTMA